MEKYITTKNGLEITEEALKSIYDMFIAPTDERDYNAWKNDRIEKGIIRRIEEK